MTRRSRFEVLTERVNDQLAEQLRHQHVGLVKSVAQDRARRRVSHARLVREHQSVFVPNASDASRALSEPDADFIVEWRGARADHTESENTRGCRRGLRDVLGLRDSNRPERSSQAKIGRMTGAVCDSNRLPV